MTAWVLPGVPDPVYPFVGLAVFMIAFEAGLLVAFFRYGQTPRLSRAFFVTYLLASSIFFWVALPPAVLNPNLNTWTWAIQAMMLPMTAPFLWMMTLIVRWNERTIRPGTWFWPGMLTGALVLNELLMAWAFVTLAPNGFAPTVATTFAASVNSVWFASAMLASMTAVLVRLPLSRTEKIAFGGLAASVLAAPWISVAPLLAGSLMMLSMAGTFGVLLWDVARRRTSETVRAGRILLWVAIGFAVMSGGAIASVLLTDPNLAGVPFALTTLTVMTGEMVAVLRMGTRLGARPRPEPLPFTAKSSASVYLR